MINTFHRPPLSTVRTRLSQVLIVTGLSAIGAFSGLVPQTAPHFVGLVSATAVAQTPDVTSYARAAFEIEQLRQRKYSEAKERLRGNVPPNVCGQQEPPAEVRTICDEFMRGTTNIIKQNGMSVSQFNDITRRKDTDPNLQQQIQAELLKIQKSAP
jgi:hypothetical protein